MNEVAETSAANVPAEAAAATPGQRLKAARERRGLSRQKAADKLHLDYWVIEALENDEFEKIGPSVYAKGHLKHYAGMLGIPAAEIMAAYGAPPAPAPASQPRTLRMRTQEPVGIELPWGAIAAAAVAAVVVSGLVWLKPWRGNNTVGGLQQAQGPVPATATASVPTTDTPPEPPQPDEPGAFDAARDAATTVAAVAATPARVAAAESAATTPAPEPAAAADGEALPGAGRARLRLSFSADSRVEVYDAGGKPIFAGSGRANSVKTLGGDAPMRVYLSFASGVQLAINNRVVAIGPQFVAGDVAHFEVGADGVLRHDTHSAAASGMTSHASRPHG